ncbi:hypothetical protein QFC22_005082 [Naganishia vaughanmartiniae]|uniref:Uncharacterized protein n=1 Tax=Naganishia vaughanmartiniae TaxID=1424756 RepID=A0ACC2WXQ6_9TREE|nr:hypothetical protein QFC22_005082 [Naganishia vaughanmartiniae]
MVITKKGNSQWLWPLLFLASYLLSVVNAKTYGHFGNKLALAYYDYEDVPTATLVAPASAASRSSTDTAYIDVFFDTATASSSFLHATDTDTAPSPATAASPNTGPAALREAYTKPTRFLHSPNLYSLSAATHKVIRQAAGILQEASHPSRTFDDTERLSDDSRHHLPLHVVSGKKDVLIDSNNYFSSNLNDSSDPEPSGYDVESSENKHDDASAKGTMDSDEMRRRLALSSQARPLISVVLRPVPRLAVDFGVTWLPKNWSPRTDPPLIDPKIQDEAEVDLKRRRTTIAAEEEYSARKREEADAVLESVNEIKRRAKKQWHDKTMRELGRDYHRQTSDHRSDPTAALLPVLFGRRMVNIIVLALAPVCRTNADTPTALPFPDHRRTPNTSALASPLSWDQKGTLYLPGHLAYEDEEQDQQQRRRTDHDWQFGTQHTRFIEGELRRRGRYGLTSRSPSPVNRKRMLSPPAIPAAIDAAPTQETSRPVASIVRQTHSLSNRRLPSRGQDRASRVAEVAEPVRSTLVHVAAETVPQPSSIHVARAPDLVDDAVVGLLQLGLGTSSVLTPSLAVDLDASDVMDSDPPAQDASQTENEDPEITPRLQQGDLVTTVSRNAVLSSVEAPVQEKATDHEIVLPVQCDVTVQTIPDRFGLAKRKSREGGGVCVRDNDEARAPSPSLQPATPVRQVNVSVRSITFSPHVSISEIPRNDEEDEHPPVEQASRPRLVLVAKEVQEPLATHAVSVRATSCDEAMEIESTLMQNATALTSYAKDVPALEINMDIVELVDLPVDIEVEAGVVELPVDMQVETKVFQLSADMEVEAEVVELSADMEVEATTIASALDPPCQLSTEVDDMGMAFERMELSTQIDDMGLALEDMKLETGNEEMEAENQELDVDVGMEDEEPASLAAAPPFAPQVDMEVESMLMTTMEPDLAPTQDVKAEMVDATMDDDNAAPLTTAPFAPPVEMQVQPMLLTTTDADNANTVNAAQPIVPSFMFTAPSKQIVSVLPPLASAVVTPLVFKLPELPPECSSRSMLDSRFLQVPATPTPRALVPSTSKSVFKVPEVPAMPTPQARTSYGQGNLQSTRGPRDANFTSANLHGRAIFEVPAVPKRLLPNMVKRSAPSPMMHPALQAVAPWAATRQVPAAADVVKLGVSAVYPPVNQVTAARITNAMVEAEAPALIPTQPPALIPTQPPALIPTQPRDPFILARKVKAAPKRTAASRETRVAAAVAQAQAQAPPIPELDWNDLSNFNTDSPAGLLALAEAMARAPLPPMDEAIAAGPFYTDPVTGEIRVFDDDYSGTGLDGTAAPFGLGDLPTFDNSVFDTANNDTSPFVIFNPSAPRNPVGEPVTNVAPPPET